MRVAIDLGFGYTKVKTSLGDKLCFPSVLGKKRKDSYLSSFLKSDDYVVKIDIEGDKKEYYVGEMAEINGFSRKWNSDKSMDSKTIKVLALSALAILSNGEDIELKIGLPISLFQKYKLSEKNALEGLKAKVAVNGEDAKEINIKSVDVGVQGLGAYFSIALDDKEDKTLSSLALIDIGYRTVDYLFVIKGSKGMSLSDEFSGTLEDEGLNVALNDALRELKADEIEIGLSDLEKAIISSQYLVDTGKKEVDISKYIESSFSRLAERISSKLNIIWQGLERELPLMYLTGGGGEMLFKYLKKYYPVAKKHKNPRFANCDGYLLVL